MGLVRVGAGGLGGRVGATALILGLGMSVAGCAGGSSAPASPPSQAASGAPVASAGSLAWRQVGDTASLPGGAILAIARSDQTIVAVGTAAQEMAGAWTSSDGESWAAVGAADAFSGFQIQAITSRSEGFIAVGFRTIGAAEGGSFAAWTSPDGKAWSLTSDAKQGLEPTGLVGGGPGLVAVGSTLTDVGSGTYAARVVTSSDGTNWTLLASRPAFEKSRMSGIAKGGPGFVAVGSTSGTIPARAVVWTSSDGVTWDRVPDSPVFADSLMLAVTAGPAGLLAVGSGANGAAAWTSADGLAWARVPDSPAFAGAEMHAVTSTNPGFIAVGFSRDGSAIWTSADGANWNRLPDQPDFAGTQMTTVVAGPISVIGGRANPAEQARGEIWFKP